jgi:steroid delta-isomerase-like uncharacterized protein
VGPPAGASNGDIIRWSFQQLNRHDAEAMSALWTDQTLQRFPDRNCHGTAEIRAYFEETFAAIPDLVVEMLSLVEDGDEVFVRWRLSGTQKGRLQGLEGTGRKLRLDGVDHFTLRDGKIASNFVVFDQMQWARDIGLLPHDGSNADKAVKAAFNAKARVAKEVQARRSTS